tara:strand:+ start:21246 stop:21368 length:123 start_codon:yes stop_codon:yes gene_type:complete
MTPFGLLGLLLTIFGLGLVTYMLIQWNNETPRKRKDDRKI